MKGKKVFKILFVVVILLICGITIFGVFESSSYKKKKKELEENFTWQAKYIWFADERNLPEELKANEWVSFRKTINIDSRRDAKHVTAKIAVDSKYLLYVNGELVLRDGGLKRGQKPSSIYYDEVPLDGYLKKGENTIAILVWYFGKTSYSHISSTNGALLFQAQIGEQTIISDSSWKVVKNPAYKKFTPIINPRLSEENIYYDATEELQNWYGKNYDDSRWDNSVELGTADDSTWGDLIQRNIPFFEYSSIKDYENSSQYKGQIFKQDTLLELDLPRNIQFVPYLKIESTEGKEIDITLDEEYASEGKEHKTIYITKTGVQEFESPAWINGEKVYYFIPEGVKVLQLGYRETNYKIDETGSFSADDEFYGNLFEKAYNTLVINMRESYMDCPDRERAQWWGDASISMEEATYSLDPNAICLYRKGVDTTIGWKHDDILLTITPTNESHSMHLPIQMQLGVVSMYEHYLYTGDMEYLEEIYPHVKDYLYMWQIEPDGLASYPAGFALWRWEDSSGDCDYVAAENMWYYYALTKLYDMAIILDKQEDLLPIEDRMNNLNIAINDKLCTEIGYKEWQFDKYDIRANAVAVLADLVDEDMYDSITNVLLDDVVDSPFMEKYVLEALCKMGKIEEAQDRMKLQYQKMVDSEISTLTEYFDETTGSKNHAWSGGPIIIMQKYFAGITPSNPGFTEINVKPQFGKLNSITSKVNTVSGTIELNATKTSKETKMEITTPVRTRVAIEKTSDNPIVYINGWCVYKNGENKFNLQGDYETEDENYIYYFVNKGDYTIKVK